MYSGCGTALERVKCVKYLYQGKTKSEPGCCHHQILDTVCRHFRIKLKIRKCMKYSFLHACFHNAWLCFCCIRLFCTVGAVTVISPLELIRTKMQSKKFSYEELHRFVSKKVSEDGWISLWRGWAPTILRDVPFSGRIYLLHFKQLCMYHF